MHIIITLFTESWGSFGLKYTNLKDKFLWYGPNLQTTHSNGSHCREMHTFGSQLVQVYIAYHHSEDRRCLHEPFTSPSSLSDLHSPLYTTDKQTRNRISAKSQTRQHNAMYNVQCSCAASYSMYSYIIMLLSYLGLWLYQLKIIHIWVLYLLKGGNY